MVREARFSFGDDDGFEPPFEPSGFDERDDDLLDVFDTGRPLHGRTRREPRRRDPRRNEAASSESRHLAGADWLREE